MKKVLIKLLMLIGIMCMIIMSNNSISFGSDYYDQLSDYLFYGGTRIFKKDNNEKVQEEDLESDQMWGNAMWQMVKYINSKDYKQILEKNNGNLLKYIELARVAINNASTYASAHEDAWKEINEISNGKYAASADGFREFINNHLGPATHRLLAAYDYGSEYKSQEGINILDSYETKFKYNYNKVQTYYNRYNTNGLSGSDEEVRLRRVFEFKNGNRDNSIGKSTYYVDEGESYEEKMQYNLDKIKLYIIAYNGSERKGMAIDNLGLSKETENERRGILAEWAYMATHNGKHSSFFNNNYSQTGNGQRLFSLPSGSKEYDKTVEEQVKKDSGKTVETVLKELRDELLGQKVELVSDSVFEKMEDNVVINDRSRKKETDLGIAFQQPERIEAKRRGRNSRCCK